MEACGVSDVHDGLPGCGQDGLGKSLGLPEYDFIHSIKALGESCLFYTVFFVIFGLL